jgi:hypothetical protein
MSSVICYFATQMKYQQLLFQIYNGGIRKYASLLHFIFCQLVNLILQTVGTPKNLIERESGQFRLRQYILLVL